MSDLKQIHPTERLFTPGGDGIDIGAETVPLIWRLWGKRQA